MVAVKIEYAIGPCNASNRPNTALPCAVARGEVRQSVVPRAGGKPRQLIRSTESAEIRYLSATAQGDWKSRRHLLFGPLLIRTFARCREKHGSACEPRFFSRMDIARAKSSSKKWE